MSMFKKLFVKKNKGKKGPMRLFKRGINKGLSSHQKSTLDSGVTGIEIPTLTGGSDLEVSHQYSSLGSDQLSLEDLIEMISLEIEILDAIEYGVPIVDTIEVVEYVEDVIETFEDVIQAVEDVIEDAIEDIVTIETVETIGDDTNIVKDVIEEAVEINSDSGAPDLEVSHQEFNVGNITLDYIDEPIVINKNPHRIQYLTCPLDLGESGKQEPLVQESISEPLVQNSIAEHLSLDFSDLDSEIKYHPKAGECASTEEVSGLDWAMEVDDKNESVPVSVPSVTPIPTVTPIPIPIEPVLYPKRTLYTIYEDYDLEGNYQPEDEDTDSETQSKEIETDSETQSKDSEQTKSESKSESLSEVEPESSEDNGKEDAQDGNQKESLKCETHVLNWTMAAKEGSLDWSMPVEDECLDWAMPVDEDPGTNLNHHQQGSLSVTVKNDSNTIKNGSSYVTLKNESSNVSLEKESMNVKESITIKDTLTSQTRILRWSMFIDPEPLDWAMSVDQESIDIEPDQQSLNSVEVDIIPDCTQLMIRKQESCDTLVEEEFVPEQESCDALDEEFIPKHPRNQSGVEQGNQVEAKDLGCLPDVRHQDSSMTLVEGECEVDQKGFVEDIISGDVEDITPQCVDMQCDDEDITPPDLGQQSGICTGICTTKTGTKTKTNTYLVNYQSKESEPGDSSDSGADFITYLQYLKIQKHPSEDSDPSVQSVTNSNNSMCPDEISPPPPNKSTKKNLWWVRRKWRNLTKRLRLGTDSIMEYPHIEEGNGFNRHVIPNLVLSY